MALRDAAVVGYAETKIVEKSDRDVWEIGRRSGALFSRCREVKNQFSTVGKFGVTLAVVLHCKRAA
jgi:hypothetical protein